MTSLGLRSGIRGLYTCGMAVVSNCRTCGKEIRRNGSKPGVTCSRKCRGEWQTKRAIPDHEWLYGEYVTKGRTCPEIARDFGKDPTTVHHWLELLGIPRRPRGSYTAEMWKQGICTPNYGYCPTPEVREAQRQRLLASGHVPYLKNGVHWLKGKKGAIVPTWKGGITPERQSFYSTPEWKEAVKAVWHRDDAICQRCKVDHRTIDRKAFAFDIHHIVSFAVKELRCVVSNLVLLCETCHYFVHSNANTEKEYLG